MLSSEADEGEEDEEEDGVLVNTTSTMLLKCRPLIDLVSGGRLVRIDGEKEGREKARGPRIVDSGLARVGRQRTVNPVTSPRMSRNKRNGRAKQSPRYVDREGNEERKEREKTKE